MNSPLEHPFTGAELRDGGIKVAIEHADMAVADWSKQATAALDLYLASHNGSFMAEEVRTFAHEVVGIPLPPSNRAWGAIIQSAAREKKIRSIGYGHVKNARAHRANAAIWQKISPEEGLCI